MSWQGLALWPNLYRDMCGFDFTCRDVWSKKFSEAFCLGLGGGLGLIETLGQWPNNR